MKKNLLQNNKILLLISSIAFATNFSKAQIQPVMVADQSKLVLWLSADSGALNSSNLPALINDDIYKWNDLSGNGWVFENRSSSRRPNLASVSGEKYLDFTSGDLLEHTNIKDVMNGLNEFTMVLVIKSDNNNTENGIVDAEVADLSDDILTIRYDMVGNISGRNKVIKAGISTNINGNQVESSANKQTTSKQILVLTYKQNDKLKLYINGDLDQTSSANVANALSGITKFLVGKGSKDNSATKGWDGKISEVLFYKKEFSADTIASVKSALSSIKSIATGGWNNTSTWDCSCIPGITADVQISTGHTVLMQSNVTIDQLTIKNGGTLDADAISNYSLSLKGSIFNYGSFLTRNGTLNFSGTGTQNIYGNNSFYKVNISNTLGVKVITGNQFLKSIMTITSGSFTTNNSLTILSTAAETGSIAALTGVRFYGNVTMQRYHYAPVNGWLNLASPLKSQTLQTWNDDIITTGFPGSQYPTYPFVNIRSYSETATGFKDNGFTDATDITNAIPNGLGYWAYIAAGTFTIDATGPLLIGNLNYPITYTNSGSVIDDGWNLLSNPYPSAIDWDNASGWTKTNLNNAIYVWDATIQQYTSYINGIGINGGTRYIPSSQSFWIQTNASSPALTIKETAKTSVNGNYKSNPLDGGTFSLKLSGNTYSDETAIIINPDATFEFDGLYDAYKFEGGTLAPRISSLTPMGTDLAINAMPELNESISMPIKVIVPTNGNYKLIVNGISEFTASACIILEDTETGSMYDLKTAENDTLIFNLQSTTLEARFILHLSKPIETLAINASCDGFNDGSIIATAQGTAPYTYVWRNEMDEVIFSNTSENNTSILENLSAGFYTILIGNSGEMCSSNNSMIQISEPELLEVNDITSNPTCAQFNDGTIALQIEGGTAPYEINWADGNTGLLVENLTEGVYMVSVSDLNGCTDIKTFNLDNQFAVEASFDAPLTVDINNNLPIDFTNTSTDANEFIWNFGDGSEISNDENPTHFYETTGTFTVNLTAKNGNCENTISKPIEITNSSVGLNSLLLQNELIITNNSDDVQINMNFKESRDIKITLINTIGQIITTKIVYKVSQDYITISLPETKGIYLVNIYDQKTKENFTKRILR
jgi:PKD repeat protein